MISLCAFWCCALLFQVMNYSYDSSHPESQRGVFTTTDQLDSYEKLWHLCIYKPSHNELRGKVRIILFQCEGLRMLVDSRNGLLFIHTPSTQNTSLFILLKQAWMKISCVPDEYSQKSGYWISALQVMVYKTVEVIQAAHNIYSQLLEIHLVSMLCLVLYTYIQLVS